jgi:hypothetical protein
MSKVPAVHGYVDLPAGLGNHGDTDGSSYFLAFACSVLAILRLGIAESEHVQMMRAAKFDGIL